MLHWIQQSFYRQVLTVLLVGGFTITSVFGALDYLRERDQLKSILETDASHLASTLSLVIADDIFYRKYFELWNRIDTVFRHHREKTRLLYNIREIAVTDNQGLILGHTNPKEHPLQMLDAHQLFDTYTHQDGHNGNEQVIWLDDPQPMLLVRYPVYFSNEKVGDITFELDLQPVQQLQHNLIRTYLTNQFLFMIILILTARFLARWLSRPLEQASNVLSLLGTGAVELPELRSRKDELKRLASAIEDADQRIHAAQFAAQNRQAELEAHVKERTREIEAFTYSVSHDLRSPLRAMDGFSLALMEDCEDKLDANGKDYLRRIRGAAVRMGDIIDDLLMLSRVNRQNISFSPVNLTRIANDIIDDLREQQPERKVEIHIADGLHTQGDSGLLRITLTNLLGNAWKYSAKTEHARIEFGHGEHRGKPVFWVRDNGTGFDKQYAEKIFGAFQRLHGRDEYDGTGIGLTIVQRIILRHRGEIWAEGTIGEGATFYFYLGDSENVDDVTSIQADDKNN